MNRVLGKPLVSVILASYNHEEFIEAAVFSVLNQSHENLELIVIDDASTDRTAEIVSKITDSRLRLITIKENRRYQNRNMALSYAKGKYIAFQNSDDVWSNEKLDKQIKILENDVSLSSCFTDVEMIDEKDNKLNKGNPFTTTNRDKISWLRYFFDTGNCLCLSSSLIRKDILDKIGYFNPSFFQLSDLDLWVRTVTEGDFHIIDEKLTSMRLVPKRNLSMMSTTGRSSGLELIELYKNYCSEPILKLLPEIFKDLFPKDYISSDVISLGILAKHSWSLSQYHTLFGNDIISAIIKDNKNREELVNYFGVDIIHQLIKQRSYIEIIKDEKPCPNLYRLVKFIKKILFV